MREVIPNRLWIGNAQDLRNVRAVLQRDISAVIDLAIDEPPVIFPRDMIYCRLPIVDGGENSPIVLSVAIRTGVTLLSGGVATLVACSGGMSRSPAVAAAILAVLERFEPNAALKQIALNGPHDVSPNLWTAVCDVLRSFA